MKPICLSLLFFAALAGIPDAAVAQERRPYQIEVLVFERQYRNDSPLDEKWPRNITLSYPKNTVALGELLPPDEAEADEIRRLPDSQFKLKRQRDALDRDRRMRVLFHGIWEQPLLSAAKAPSIALRGGNGYGEHFELEGSIKLSVSHYVHLDTDLWFSEFVPNHGQLPEFWLTLPPWPGAETTAEEGSNGGLVMEMAPEENRTDGDRRLPDGRDGNTLGDSSREPGAVGPMDDQYDDPQQEFLKSPYFIENIVTFRQSRRMRSTEIHYLDHPRLGLLVRVEPVKAQP